MRLSISSLAGTDRTLVAVGTLRLAAMLTAVRAAAPRSLDAGAPAAAGGPAAGTTWPGPGRRRRRCGGAPPGLPAADAGALAWPPGRPGPARPGPALAWLAAGALAGPAVRSRAGLPRAWSGWPCCPAARAATLPAGGE